MAVAGLPIEQAEKGVLYLSRDGTAAAIADGHMIDLAHGCDFGSSAGHEYFIRRVKLLT